MDEPVAEKRSEVCHRCLQPVPSKAQRCPHCGDPLKTGLNARLVLGLLGATIFLLVAFFVVARLMHTDTPADADQQQQDGSTPSAPAPEKKPALGQ